MTTSQDFYEQREIEQTFAALSNVSESIINFEKDTERSTFKRVRPLLKQLLKVWPKRIVL